MKIFRDQVYEWRRELLEQEVPERVTFKCLDYEMARAFFEKAGYVVEEMPPVGKFEEHGGYGISVMVPPDILTLCDYVVKQGLVEVPEEKFDWRLSLGRSGEGVDGWEIVGPFRPIALKPEDERNCFDICSRALERYRGKTMTMREFFAALFFKDRIFGKGLYLLGDDVGASCTFMFVHVDSKGGIKLKQVDDIGILDRKLLRFISRGLVKVLVRDVDVDFDFVD